MSAVHALAGREGTGARALWFDQITSEHNFAVLVIRVFHGSRWQTGDGANVDLTLETRSMSQSLSSAGVECRFSN